MKINSTRSGKSILASLEFNIRKNDFKGSLFSHYLGLKPLLICLPRVVVSPTKPSM